ncbi:MAG: hypothetical protein HY812_22315 [Planctomycetes bacterium]|nr:hypothetical protein [Planctomycetota bacterium]
MARAASCFAPFLALLAGCASAVVPPADPAEPLCVYVIQNAKHFGLILPRDAGGFVEYGYGDWEWYALEEDSWSDACGTVVWPTLGTLARRESHVAGFAGLRLRYPAGAALLPVEAEAGRVRGLLRGLDERFARGFSQGFYSARYDMYFVPDAERFWFPHMCADETAEWLEELGCTVSWTPIRMGLRVQDAP